MPCWCTVSEIVLQNFDNKTLKLILLFLSNCTGIYLHCWVCETWPRCFLHSPTAKSPSELPLFYGKSCERSDKAALPQGALSGWERREQAWMVGRGKCFLKETWLCKSFCISIDLLPLGCKRKAQQQEAASALCAYSKSGKEAVSGTWTSWIPWLWPPAF